MIFKLKITSTVLLTTLLKNKFAANRSNISIIQNFPGAMFSRAYIMDDLNSTNIR